MNIKYKDIKLTPDLDSVCRMKISDKEYFSSKYADFISNSRLKLINPEQEGSWIKYQEGFTGEITSSLQLGSSIHSLLLQPDDFQLGPDLAKPTAKLGLVLDCLRTLRQNHVPLQEAIVRACKQAHYYENNIPYAIKQIVTKGLPYYKRSKKITDETIILLSKKDRDTVINCLKNISQNRFIQKLLHPTDLFGDPILSFNEDAFFINITGTYKEKTCSLKLKMKADNWSIDPENKIITLNDLKTTGHVLESFMEHSLINYHYPRQFSMYLWILLQYCKKHYNYNSKEWTVKCNVIVVETILNNRCFAYPISQELLDEGRKEFCKLIKMIAYYKITDDSTPVTFI